MGPRSENRGYAQDRHYAGSGVAASMGPRSENRGYVIPKLLDHGKGDGFNGSTVREPWLWEDPPWPQAVRLALQWVHGPRTVVMQCFREFHQRRRGRLQW